MPKSYGVDPETGEKLRQYEYNTRPVASNYKPNEREEKFIHAIVELGFKAEKAAEYAGYGVGGAYVRRTRLLPLISKAVAQRLGAGAPAALQTVLSIMQDENVPPHTRLKAAEMWLDRSGFAKSVDVRFTDDTKDVSDMDEDELRERLAEKLQSVGAITNKEKALISVAEAEFTEDEECPQ